MDENILELELDRATAQQYLRLIASDSGRIQFTEHVLEHMEERDVSNRQVITCLRKGRIVEGPGP